MQNSFRTRTRVLAALCFFVSLVVGFVLTGCGGPPRHPGWNSATGAEQYERLMWKAIQEKDWGNAERHLSPTFIGITPEGQMLDRSGWIAYWKSAQPVEFSQGEIVVQPEGADMKVTSIVQLQNGGKAAGGSGLRAVSIGQQIKARWALTAISLTPIQSK